MSRDPLYSKEEAMHGLTQGSQVVAPNIDFSTLSVAQVRGLLSYPNWNKFQQVITYTRSYEDGLRVADLVLQFLKRYQAEFSREEIRQFEQHLYVFGLSMLDKLDRWDEYLQVWQWVRENTDYTLTYSASSRENHGDRIEPFILSQDARTIYVHFLYTVSHRKAVIERKKARRDRGEKTGNLVHERQEDLSNIEIRERLEWIIRFVETGEYDFDPPASRQRANRVDL